MSLSQCHCTLISVMCGGDADINEELESYGRNVLLMFITLLLYANAQHA